jgi:hypothetical protein
MLPVMRILPSAFLYLNGVVYAYVAWLFLSDPQTWFEALGVSVRSEVALTELRTTYGGLFGGLAVFLLLSGWKKEWVEPGTLLLVVSYAGLVGVRSWGILVDDAYNDFLLQIYIAEWLSLVLSLLAWFSVRRR